MERTMLKNHDFIPRKKEPVRKAADFLTLRASPKTFYGYLHQLQSYQGPTGFADILKAEISVELK